MRKTASLEARMVSSSARISCRGEAAGANVDHTSRLILHGRRRGRTPFPRCSVRAPRLLLGVRIAALPLGGRALLLVLLLRGRGFSALAGAYSRASPICRVIAASSSSMQLPCALCFPVRRASSPSSWGEASPPGRKPAASYAWLPLPAPACRWIFCGASQAI
jgi:hypothetical protein